MSKSQPNKYAYNETGQYGYTTGHAYDATTDPASGFSSVPPPPGGVAGTTTGAGAPPFSPAATATEATAVEGAIQGVPLYDDNDQLRGKFVVQGYKDIWAAVLFIVSCLTAIVLGIVSYATSFDDSEHIYGSNGTITVNTRYVSLSGGKLVGALFAIILLCTVLAICSLLLFAKFPRQAIIASLVASVVLMLISCVVSFIGGAIFPAVVMLLLTILNAVMFWFYRRRIPFSALLLKTATDIIWRYKALIMINFLLIGVFTLFTVFWAAMVYPSVYRSSHERGTGSDAALLLFGLFVFYWASQVAFNVIHVTTSGVTATWYFVGGEVGMPGNPTRQSLKRACTTSFGSICFGSLLVAILRTLRYLAHSHRESENSFIACLLECIISCIESLVEYFNHYAFVYCAVYGYGYIEAAKKTCELAKNCAFAALFNDSLVGTALSMTALAVSCIAFLIFWAAFGIAAASIAALVCLAIHVQIFRVIDSAVTTLFVCFAEEPNALAVVNNDLYQAIHAANTV